MKKLIRNVDSQFSNLERYADACGCKLESCACVCWCNPGQTFGVESIELKHSTELRLRNMTFRRK